MYKLMVALRYMRRNWLNLVGVAAVAIGVLVLIVVLSVMKGFDEEFRARVRATLSDLIIENWSDEPFANYEELMAQIEQIEHVKACAPRYEGLALLTLRKKLPDGTYAPGEQRRYGAFLGIDLPREVKATDFADYVRAWRGKAAREELATIFSQGDVGIAATPTERIVYALNTLCPEDLQLVDAKPREKLAAWAKAAGISLQSAFRTAASAPVEWGEVPDSKLSPAFAGSELLVIGQDENGVQVSMGPGDQVVVFSATDNFANQTFRRCQVNGEFRSGMYDYDARNIYLPLADAQRFMSNEGKVTSINVRLDSFDNAPVVRAALLGILTPEELRRGLEILRSLGGTAVPKINEIGLELKRLAANDVTWFATGDYRAIAVARSVAYDTYAELEKLQKSGSPNAAALDFQKLVLKREGARLGRAGKMTLRVSTWEDKRRPMLRAVMLERQIMGVILFFVILVAGFLILSIVHTTVLSKIRDIGILKSIGGSVGGIMSIFLLNGLLMGAVGSALGTLGGMFITKNINTIQAALEKLVGYSLFPRDIYYLDKIPVDQHPFWNTTAICLTAIVVSLLASAYPAWKASRMSAVEALRYE